MAQILLKSVCEFASEEFYIPNYQRGYRWEAEQVSDLLDDLFEFYNDKYCKNKYGKEIYCLQPLVVQKVNDVWNVIDGQQRLTTLFILISCLSGSAPYTLEYQTRNTSKQFLENITKEYGTDYQDNSDYYYMHFAKEVIKMWLANNNKKDFLEMIKTRVKFIWYELDINEDPINVFTRLNIGKIGLTESELIKALFLNRNNFKESGKNKDQLLSLVEIANEWDQIEYKLQDDRFWLFLHSLEYEKPTRIDFLLNLEYEISATNIERFSSKTYPLFSYFYDSYMDEKDKYSNVSFKWNRIRTYFNIFEEWYNDEELYHYVGYISAVGEKKSAETVKELIEEYIKCSSKSEFINHLKNEIKVLCKESIDLDYIYENEGEKKKRAKRDAFPLLLLHNVQTVIDQNESIKEAKKYSLPSFERFPFHLLKKEHWDIEHIRPNSCQDFEGDRKKSERAKYLFVIRESADEDIGEIIKKYDRNIIAGQPEEDAFNELWNDINNANGKELSDTQKNKIWNYVLLDASTNREYGNACFSIKREYVLKKSKGIKPKLIVDKNNYIVSVQDVAEIAFVPVCTSSVFSKAYTHYPEDLKYWSEKDAAYYRFDIEERLWWYLKDMLNSKFTKEEYMNLFQEYKKYVIDNKAFDKSMHAYYCEKVNCSI